MTIRARRFVPVMAVAAALSTSVGRAAHARSSPPVPAPLVDWLLRGPRARDLPDPWRSAALDELVALDRSRHRATAVETGFSPAPLRDLLGLPGVLGGLSLGAGGLALGEIVATGTGSRVLDASPSVMPAGVVLGGILF